MLRHERQKYGDKGLVTIEPYSISSCLLDQFPRCIQSHQKCHPRSIRNLTTMLNENDFCLADCLYLTCTASDFAKYEYVPKHGLLSCRTSLLPSSSTNFAGHKGCNVVGSARCKVAQMRQNVVASAAADRIACIAVGLND
jgi:hypothetical protein